MNHNAIEIEYVAKPDDPEQRRDIEQLQDVGNRVIISVHETPEGVRVHTESRGSLHTTRNTRLIPWHRIYEIRYFGER